jgi:hypothetical protein
MRMMNKPYEELKTVTLCEEREVEKGNRENLKKKEK